MYHNKKTHNFLGSAHWSALFMVLRYLKGIIDYEIHYGRYFFVVEGHIDAT